jgi:hypothetical protein
VNSSIDEGKGSSWGLRSDPTFMCPILDNARLPATGCYAAMPGGGSKGKQNGVTRGPVLSTEKAGNAE